MGPKELTTGRGNESEPQCVDSSSFYHTRMGTARIMRRVTIMRD